MLRGGWSSGLRRCYQNRKVPGSNPARRLAGPRDPAPLREAPGDPLTGYVKRSDQHRRGEAVPSIIAQTWPWGSQIAVKKKFVMLSCIYMLYIP